MKHTHLKMLSLFFVTGLFLTSCGGDDTTDPVPDDTNNNTTTIQEVNIVIFGSDTIKMTEITCNPNTFGKPRLGFTAKNEDKSISANVELRGTDPANGDKFTVDPDLDNGTSKMVFYYDKKNWTCELNASNMVTHLSDDTRRNVSAKDVVIVNDKDDQEKLSVEFNLTCTKP